MALARWPWIGPIAAWLFRACWRRVSWRAFKSVDDLLAPAPTARARSIILVVAICRVADYDASMANPEELRIEGWISVSATAACLGVSIEAIYKLARRGRLHSHRVPGLRGLLFSESEVAAHRPAKRGNPNWVSKAIPPV